MNNFTQITNIAVFKNQTINLTQPISIYQLTKADLLYLHFLFYSLLFISQKPILVVFSIEIIV